MAATNVGHRSGARALTAWQQTQAGRTRRALTQRFLDNVAIAGDSFARAHTNQINGMVRLVAIAALDHLNSANANRLTLANLINTSQQDLDATAGTASGTVLDLSA